MSDSSGVNRTAAPRRALSVTLADAEATSVNPAFVHEYGDGSESTVLFGTKEVPARLGHGAQERRYQRHFDGIAPVENWTRELVGEKQRLEEIGLSHLSKL